MDDIVIGDILKIVGNRSKHGFEMGEKVVIAKFVCDGYKAILQRSLDERTTFENPDLWYVEYCDVEKI